MRLCRDCKLHRVGARGLSGGKRVSLAEEWATMVRTRPLMTQGRIYLFLTKVAASGSVDLMSRVLNNTSVQRMIPRLNIGGVLVTAVFLKKWPLVGYMLQRDTPYKPREIIEVITAAATALSASWHIKDQESIMLPLEKAISLFSPTENSITDVEKTNLKAALEILEDIGLEDVANTIREKLPIDVTMDFIKIQ